VKTTGLLPANMTAEVTREPIKIVVKHTMPDAELSASNETK
jgi:hypothetical protein